jgi:tetratricopeptide (TPR) repeat protein
MYGKVESFVAAWRSQKFNAGVTFGIVLMALAALCISAAAEENTAEDWYQKGQDLARNGSLLDAVNAYDNAIDLNPGNLDARLNKAMALHKAGKTNESIAAQNEAVKAAISYLGDLNQSVQVFNKVIEPATSSLPAELAEAWDQRGFLLADLAGPLGDNVSMYEEAITYFDRAIELDPQRTSVWINKGAVLGTRLNRYDEALLAYEKAIELGGADAEDNESLSNAWNGKGDALAKLGRFNESIDAFDKAIELNPQTAAFVWLSKGDVFNESGRYDEAVKAYDKVVELNSDSMKALAAHAYGGKGDALSAWGRYDEAVKAYDNAIEQYPVESMGAQDWYKKGLALETLGRKNEADAAFAKARVLGY